MWNPLDPEVFTQLGSPSSFSRFRIASAATRSMYVLYDGSETYTLSDQKGPEKFAGQKVTVTGSLDTKTKTIRVDRITATQ